MSRRLRPFQVQISQQNTGVQLTFNILHDHAQVPACLKGAEHGNHKGVLSEGEDVSLHEHLLDLVPQHQVLPVDLLHGKALTGFLVAHQKYSSAHGQITRST